MLELLWSTCHTLTGQEADVLTELGSACCPVCLDDMAAGDEVLCVPCEAVHIGHWACMDRWLKQARNCPCCRFELPNASSDPTRARSLVEHSLEAVRLLALAGKEHCKEWKQDAQEQASPATSMELAVRTQKGHGSTARETWAAKQEVAQAPVALPTNEDKACLPRGTGQTASARGQCRSPPPPREYASSRLEGRLREVAAYWAWVSPPTAQRRAF